jgi:hypothetical protein
LPRAAPWYRPVALQWGGQITLGPGGTQKFHFALATSIETVCRLLDVDVVRDWNLGHPEYWGEMGHYAIGLKACKLVSQASLKLHKLLDLNSANIGFDDAILRDPDQFQKRAKGYKDVPLADVPDDVWRNPTEYGGRSGLPGHPDKNNDGNNHFADMDQPGVGKYAGKTLMQLYRDNKQTLSITTWDEFYTLLIESGENVNRGAVPFRIWQAFDAMVEYLKAGDVVGYICVAGIVAHYVGDACQPLHISRLHHGYPPVKKGTVAYAVHEVYETTMLDQHAADVVQGLNQRLAKPSAIAQPTMKTGEEAARKLVDLMIATFKRLSPEDIIQTYQQGHSKDDRAARLWAAYQDQTLDNMAECCTYLASLWESAWLVAKAEQLIPDSQLVAFDYRTQLWPKYRPQSFFPSVGLADMKSFCQ